MLHVLFLLFSLAALSSGIPPGRQQCPMFRCMAPRCDAPQRAYFRINGRRCQGCPYCPTPQKRLADWTSLGDRCPIPMCAYPYPCSVALVTNSFTWRGRRCPGCAVCPAGNGGLQLQGVPFSRE